MSLITERSFPTIPARRISGHTIAKSRWSPQQRAQIAAQWRRGQVQIAPTTRLAADVFGVSVQLVNAAIAKTTAAPSLTTQTISIPESERAAVARALGEDQLWKLLEVLA
jgi:hypothetical protein